MIVLDTSSKIKAWAKEIRAIAQTGLEYGKDVFDKERYEQLNALSNEMLSTISGKTVPEINKLLPIETGYATPKVAVRGLIFNKEKILMVKETADGCWTLPGGWCDIGITASENVVKEIEEETGLKTRASRLLALFDQTKYRPSITLQHIYTAYFQCHIIEGKLRGSIETTDVAFFSLDNLPPLSKERMTKEQLEKVISVAKANNHPPYFD